MLLTNDYLTVWELAHRLSNKRPNLRSSFVIPPDVKDNLRLIINEIFHLNLHSTLLMEKWSPDSELEPYCYVRHYLDEIEDCINGKKIDRNLMDFIQIGKSDFIEWCIKTEYPYPKFWVTEKEIESVRSYLSDSDSEEPEYVEETIRIKPRESQRLEERCQKLACKLWKEYPDMNITAMANHEQIIQLCTTSKKTYTEKTRRKWVRKVAPSHLKGKSGRPKKQ